MLDVRGSYYGQTLGKATRLIVVIFACVLISSCQTVTQRQVASIQEGSEAANKKIMACVSKIETNPAYQSIALHTPLNGQVNPTLAQLNDNGKPNDEEVQVIIAIHNEMAPCRERAIEDYMKIAPGIVPTIVHLYHESDLIAAELIQRKITWGEANKKSYALRVDYLAQIQVASVQLERDLAASHQGELAQRQAALNSLSQWADQQQVLIQNQQMINSLIRPVITNCSNYDNSTHCRSY